MSAQYTPGPWTVLGEDDSHPGIEALNGTFSVVILGYPEVETDDSGVRGRTNEEAIANARLIAAAPDLLEALEMMLEGGLEGPTSQAIDAAVAAITKAKEPLP